MWKGIVYSLEKIQTINESTVIQAVMAESCLTEQLDIEFLSAARADVGAGFPSIAAIEKGKPASIGEEIPNPDPGPARTKTLLHDRLPCI